MVLTFVANHLRRLRRDERGAVSVMMGFLAIPFVGFLGVGFEVSNWYLITRGMQNAADAATLAAAINNGPNYDVEALAVAGQYGFHNGVNNVTIAVTNTATCPVTGDQNCYSVTISGYTPLLMSQVVGFQGNGNINGSLQKQLNALAVAKAASPADICLLALAGSGTTPALQTNGAPTGNMNGCNSMSNTAANCNGHNLGLGISFSVGSNNGCGAKQISAPTMKDPYSTRISGNISAAGANPCSSSDYQWETHQGNHYTVAASHQLSMPIGLSGTTFWCGDYELMADVTVTTPPSGAVLIIENGQLDLNGHVFQTDSGSALTIVFSGSNTGGYYHIPADNTNGPGGALNITAPTYGPWAGIAVAQDPSLTTTTEHLNVAAAGNSPTWDITGLIYMPNATVTLKGAIDKSTFGKSCVVMVADNFQISGTGGILKSDIGNCAAAGLTMPQANVGGVALVL